MFNDDNDYLTLLGSIKLIDNELLCNYKWEGKKFFFARLLLLLSFDYFRHETIYIHEMIVLWDN